MNGPAKPATSPALTLFLCGDVMLGRGVDQVLPHPGDPAIFEPGAGSAHDYVRLAERRSGSVPAPVGFDYVWGDGLAELERRKPDLRLINLETAVTKSGSPEPKGINYRMNPDNIAVLRAARIDACTLANNHVLDWGPDGLLETLRTLEKAGIGIAGAGRTAREAAAPLIVETAPEQRVIVLAFGSPTAGVPDYWAAGENRPGVSLLPGDPDPAVSRCRDLLQDIRKPGDIVIASIHWGSNWGYAIPPSQRGLAHRLIDDARVDIVHGHSSHHPRPIQVHNGKLVLYGCGDLINDYEGIGGYEEFRDDLTLMYFPRVSAFDGKLETLDMVPFRIRKMRLQRASTGDAEWLAETLNREAVNVDTRVEACPDASLRLVWS
jgi:poly-gamma-glutamate synthesis protein (capsule biosynthesis protein)